MGSTPLALVGVLLLAVILVGLIGGAFAGTQRFLERMAFRRRLNPLSMGLNMPHHRWASALDHVPQPTKDYFYRELFLKPMTTGSGDGMGHHGGMDMDGPISVCDETDGKKEEVGGLDADEMLVTNPAEACARDVCYVLETIGLRRGMLVGGENDSQQPRCESIEALERRYPFHHLH